MSRPEHQAPPEIFYNEEESRKYTSSSHVIETQSRITRRCIELLNLSEGPKYLLDIGCGSGLSGSVISDEGHSWVGVDISRSMLEIAEEQEAEGDLMESDIGQGLPFRPGVFDGAVSVSVVQWLCNQDKTSHNPFARIKKFFTNLYNCLARGSRAVLQLYPENPQQLELLTTAAMKAGFGGGLLIDYPNSTRAKKHYLVLFCGVAANQELPRALGEGNGEQIQYEKQRRKVYNKQNKKKVSYKSKDWIVAKKERQRKQGHEVRPNSKYTGRKRRSALG